MHRHEIEPELVAALGLHRQADEPAALAGHEVDDLGRRELRGDREVALVLAVLVVADDDHAPCLDVCDRVLDGRERGCGLHRATSFSTYFANTSTSRLTTVPGAAPPSVVRCSVSGMSDTSKASPEIALTVSETPFTAMEPFSTT